MTDVGERTKRRNMKGKLQASLHKPCIILTLFALSGCSPEKPTLNEQSGLTPHEQRVIKVFHSASPSVVHITSKSLIRDRFRLSVYERDEGTGTGFVWDRNGYIVTNYHVIQEGTRAEVTLVRPSQSQSLSEAQVSFEARVIGVAPDRDLAVLKIDASSLDLAPLPLGDSKMLSVGQSALAIGNPFGFDQTLTTGVISGLGREIKSVTQRVIKGVIQTDAAINPGNSGGPLLDSSGQVIGVNTAIYSPSGAYAGIGFAVPIDTVKRVVPQLIRYGAEVRPSLGVELDEGRLSARYRLPGAMVVHVEPGSPADRAKLRGLKWRGRRLLWGDLILSVDGQRTRDATDVYETLDHCEVGQKVTLEIQRGIGRKAKRRSVSLTLQGVLSTQHK